MHEAANRAGLSDIRQLVFLLNIAADGTGPAGSVCSQRLNSMRKRHSAFYAPVSGFTLIEFDMRTGPAADGTHSI